MGRVLPSIIVPAILCLFCSVQGRAQDIHYSQFYNAPQLLNPALTGIFNGDIRLMGHYRRQWERVTADYLTFSATYDQKFYPKKRKGNDFFGFGINFNHDDAGTSILSLNGLQVGGSYSSELSKNVFLTGGVQLGFANRSFNEEDLTFGRQYVDGAFDAATPTGEDFDNTSFFFADFSIGGNLRLQKDDRRTKVDIGASLYHLNRPRQEFFDNSDSKLPSRVAVYGIGAIKLAEPLDLMLRGSLQWQGKYNEYVPGAALQIYLDQKRGKELALQVGATMRFARFLETGVKNDAVIPTVEFHYNTFSLGISYDVNVSDFKEATDRRGGPEVWVAYRIVKVQPLGRFETCPIF